MRNFSPGYFFVSKTWCLTFLKDKQASAWVQFWKVTNVLVARVMRSGYSPFCYRSYYAAPPHANDAPDSPKNTLPAASHLFLSLPAIWRKWAFYLDRATSCLAFYRLFIVIHLHYFCATQKFISLLIHLYICYYCVFWVEPAAEIYLWHSLLAFSSLERRIQLFFWFRSLLTRRFIVH